KRKHVLVRVANDERHATPLGFFPGVVVRDAREETVFVSDKIVTYLEVQPSSRLGCIVKLSQPRQQIVTLHVLFRYEEQLTNRRLDKGETFGFFFLNEYELQLIDIKRYGLCQLTDADPFVGPSSHGNPSSILL